MKSSYCRYKNVIKIILCSFIVISMLPYNGCRTKQNVYKIGVLSGLDYFADTFEGFKSKMTKLGYIENQNIEYIFYKTNYDTLKEKIILEKFINEGVDLILTFPTEVSLNAKKILKKKNIPLVFANANIECLNLINNVTSPGNNLTGVRFPGPDIALKRLELLLEILPSAKKIIVPYQLGYPTIPEQLKILKYHLVDSKISLIETPCKNSDELKMELDLLQEKSGNRFDAILMIAEPLTVTKEAFAVLGEYAEQNKIPIAGAKININGFSTILGVSTNNIAVGEQAASLADKVLRGMNAGTVPVVSAESFIQFNNLQAQKLGLNIPVGLLKQADELFQ